MARKKEKDPGIRATLLFEKDAGLREVRSPAWKLARIQLAHAAYLLQRPGQKNGALDFRIGAGPRNHRSIVISFRGRLDARAIQGSMKLRISPDSELSRVEMKLSPVLDWTVEVCHAFIDRLIKEIKLWDEPEPAVRMRIRATRFSVFWLPVQEFILPWMFHCSGGPDIQSESLRPRGFSALEPVARGILSPRGLRHFCVLLAMASKAGGRPFPWSPDGHMGYLAPEARFDPIFRENQVDRSFATRLMSYLKKPFKLSRHGIPILDGEPILREVDLGHFVFNEKLGLHQSPDLCTCSQATIAMEPKNHRLALLILLHLGLNGNDLECGERELLNRFGHGRAEHAGRSLQLLMRELAFLSKHDLIKYEKTAETGLLRIEGLTSASTRELSAAENQPEPALELKPELRMLTQLTPDDWNCIVDELGYARLAAMTELQPRLLRQITRTGRVPRSFYRAVRNNEGLSDKILEALEKCRNA